MVFDLIWNNQSRDDIFNLVVNLGESARNLGSRACEAPELGPHSESREPTWDLCPWGSLDEALGS